MSVNLPVLDQGVGYGLVVGFGAFFAISMTALSLLLVRYKSQIQTSEMLMTANHSLKVGLIASAVVSSWTLAATLLSSTTGISLHTDPIAIANSHEQRHTNMAYPAPSGMELAARYKYFSLQSPPSSLNARLHKPIRSSKSCEHAMAILVI